MVHDLWLQLNDYVFPILIGVGFLGDFLRWRFKRERTRSLAVAYSVTFVSLLTALSAWLVIDFLVHGSWFLLLFGFGLFGFYLYRAYNP